MSSIDHEQPHEQLQRNQKCCSDRNDESDPSSEYSLRVYGLTDVMNHNLGQKFIIRIKINCLDMSLKPGTGIPRHRTVHELLFLIIFLFIHLLEHVGGANGREFSLPISFVQLYTDH